MIKPYQSEGNKKEQVEQMFDNIAHHYDFLNHFLSMGIDKLWRRKAINLLKAAKPSHILDIATGTGDLALAALRLHPKQITGIDLSEEMLAHAKVKIAKAGKSDVISFEKGDSEAINYPNNTFNAAMVAFGVRNFENLDKGLSEIYRVLTPGAQFVVLEFSRPSNKVIKAVYNLYFFRILPFFGRLLSKDTRAYTYLPESVNAFPDGPDFLAYMNKAGFKNLKCRPLTFGIASIYTGTKGQ